MTVTRLRSALLSAVLVLLRSAPPASGQEADLPLEGGVEHLAFDRPESWAMKYYTAVILPTGMGVPQPTRLGALRLGFEAGWVPALGPEQRRVGFDGQKQEDLNKVPVVGRLRLAIGLPGQLTADATWAPPIEVNGLVAHPFSLGIGRPVLTAGGLTVGVRGYAGRLWSRGSFTCSGAAAPMAPAGETAGDHEHAVDMSDCQAASRDTFTASYAGVEAGGAYRFAGLHGLEAHLTTSTSYLALAFRTDAELLSHVDHRRLKTKGAVYVFAAGLRLPLGDRVGVTGEACYAPLTVRRPEEDRTVDGLFNVRGLVDVAF